MAGHNNLLVAKYNTNVALTLTNSAATIVQYDTIVYDPYALVTTGAGWVFTPNHAGYYFISASACIDDYDGWATGEWAYLQLYEGGASSSLLLFRDDLNSNGTSIRVFLSGSTMVYCTVGYTLQVRLYQSSGANQVLVNNVVYNHVSIWKV